MDDVFRKRLKETRACGLCGVEVAKTEYTETQWSNGAKGKCKKCVAEETMGQKVLLRACCSCGAEYPKTEFSRSQWEMPKRIGSQCQHCSKANQKQSHKEFSQQFGNRKVHADDNKAHQGLIRAFATLREFESICKVSAS